MMTEKVYQFERAVFVKRITRLHRRKREQIIEVLCVLRVHLLVLW